MNSNQPCRGFECIHVAIDTKRNTNAFCELASGERKEITFELCSECKVLNDCNVCIHKDTCEYVH